ncbi:hypothetical protein, partial [Rhodococcus jostii]|uniref:hypothetical protein n=1 Tax=Rhodococcus jostii TaxID=132919 RepID=UPI0036527FC2
MTTSNNPQPLTHDDVRAIVREELAEIGDLLRVVPGLDRTPESKFTVTGIDEALRRARAAEAEGGEEGMAAASSAQARPRSR